MRPASLAEPQGPQERVQLRTVEHMADVVPTADGVPAGGGVPAPRFPAGYAEDLSFTLSFSKLRRRRQNSWWKCLRPYPTLRYKGLWSRTQTFQFLLVVVAGMVGEAFKVSPRDLIQLREVEQITLKFQFLRVVVTCLFNCFSSHSRDAYESSHLAVTCSVSLHCC